jgi:hypothetical protein
VNRRTLPLLLTLGILLPGAVEAWFGRPELFGDDISYLDIAKLIRAGDWKPALNPLWSIGYPLLLSGVKPFFPASLAGELHAIFALNMLIYLAAWVSFLWLLRTAAEFAGLRLSVPLALTPLTLFAAACIFVSAAVGLGRVSSVGPDQLVACLFFLASGILLRFALHPTARDGLLLGLTLGLGFVVKGVFLPLTVILLGTALIPQRRLRATVALSAPAGMLLLMLPYAAGLSWAIGRPTLGGSGALNYAFHVNQLPHWMGWQGGPPRLGYPLHPVHLLRIHPAVFGFGEPFHVTYPPQFSLHYWYDGYRHFFSLPDALRAILTNLHALASVLHENALFVVALFVSIAILWAPHPSRPMRWVGRGLLTLWPLFLPSILGILLYIQVHLEGRYIAAFVAILATLPFLAAERASPRMRRLLVLILAAGTLANLALLAHRRLGERPRDNQWVLAEGLQRAGLRPGDRVASVTTLNDIRCTWAYAAGLHIVADIGNDAFDPGSQQEDFLDFWTKPEIQQDVLRLFRQQGAVAVIVPRVDVPPGNPAWRHIPNTRAWLLRLN